MIRLPIVLRVFTFIGLPFKCKPYTVISDCAFSVCIASVLYTDIKETFPESTSEKEQRQKHKQDVGKQVYELMDTNVCIMHTGDVAGQKL